MPRKSHMFLDSKCNVWFDLSAKQDLLLWPGREIKNCDMSTLALRPHAVYRYILNITRIIDQSHKHRRHCHSHTLSSLWKVEHNSVAHTLSCQRRPQNFYRIGVVRSNQRDGTTIEQDGKLAPRTVATCSKIASRHCSSRVVAQCSCPFTKILWEELLWERGSRVWMVPNGTAHKYIQHLFLCFVCHWSLCCVLGCEL